MSAKHTPGPWQIRHDAGVSRVFRKTKIADVYSEAFRDEATQHANADLMGAAPDLLDAVRAALPLLCGNRDAMLESEVRAYLDKERNIPDRSTLDEEALEYIMPYDEAIALAEAAIAKAVQP